MKYSFIQGNITKVQVDAIVLPANETLEEEKGISSQIFKAAGRKKLTDACKKIGNCELGGAVPTPGYKLRTSYIIHAVVPKWQDGKHNEYEALSMAYVSALNIADVMKCKTVAFPLLASGDNGFDKDMAIEIATNAINNFIPDKLINIYIVLDAPKDCEKIKQIGYILDDDSSIIVNRHSFGKKHIEEGKKIADAFVKDEIDAAFEWLKIKKNREKVIKAGVDITKIVINKLKAKGKKN